MTRKILWLTDIHMAGDGLLVNGRDPALHMAAALDHAARHHGDAEACVITGDLVDRGRADEYERVRAALSRLRVPTAMTIGNHDGRKDFLRVFRPGANGGPAHDVLDVGADWRLLLLDSAGDDPAVGSLAADRLDWLEARLAEAGDRRAIVLLHHPPLTTGMPGADNSGLPAEDKQAFARLLARHRGRVRLVGFGHCHRGFSGTIDGVPFMCQESVLFQAKANFADGRFVPDPDRRGAYGVVLLNGADAVVHTVDFEA